MPWNFLLKIFIYILIKKFLLKEMLNNFLQPNLQCIENLCRYYKFLSQTFFVIWKYIFHFFKRNFFGSSCESTLLTIDPISASIWLSPLLKLYFVRSYRHLHLKRIEEMVFWRLFGDIPICMSGRQEMHFFIMIN